MKHIRIHLLFFSSLLVLSGLTAFPIQTEFEMLAPLIENLPKELAQWYQEVSIDVKETKAVLFYGTDWLAFSHLAIALFFVPVYRDPIAYKINLKVAQVISIGVLPLAFFAGMIRSIPWFHQLIDCGFGLLSFAYLAYILQKIKQFERVNSTSQLAQKEHNNMH